MTTILDCIDTQTPSIHENGTASFTLTTAPTSDLTLPGCLTIGKDGLTLTTAEGTQPISITAHELAALWGYLSLAHQHHRLTLATA